MNTPTGFQHRLNAELSALATEPAPSPAPTPWLRRRRGPLSAAAVATAAAAVVVSALPSAGGSPAYAVTKQPDGTVKLFLDRPEGVAGMQEQLNKMGIRAAAMEVTEDCAQAVPAPEPLIVPILDRAVHSPDGRTTLTVSPRGIPHDHTLLIAADFSERTGPGPSFGVTTVEEVPECVGPDALNVMVVSASKR